METNRRLSARSPKVLKGLARTLRALKAALAAIDREIDDEVRGSPAWRATEDLLTSVPGIGPITARTLIAELPELGGIDRRRSPPGRRSAGQPRLRRDARPPRHRRWPGGRTPRVVHGRRHGHPLEPAHPRPLSPPQGPWPARQGRLGRRHAQAPHHPQRDPPGPKAMAKRLTRDTVTQKFPEAASRRISFSSVRSNTAFRAARSPSRAPSAASLDRT